MLTTLSILDAYRRSTAQAIATAPDAPVVGLGSGDNVEQRVAGYQAGIEQFLEVGGSTYSTTALCITLWPAPISGADGPARPAPMVPGAAGPGRSIAQCHRKTL